MAIPNTGPVRNSQLKTEFGRNTNPSPLSIYYRGGAYVPANIPGSPIPGGAPYCQPGSAKENGFCNSSPKDNGCWCSFMNASYTCTTPSYSHSFNLACSPQCTNRRVPVGPGGCNGMCDTKLVPTFNNCWLDPTGIYVPGGNPVPGTPTPINTGVPSNGKIGHSNLRGARR